MRLLVDQQVEGVVEGPSAVKLGNSNVMLIHGEPSAQL